MTSIVRWLLWLMLFFSPMTALAQSYMTTVTAQVKDANGTLYNSCRYSATLVNLSTSTLTLGGTALPDQFKQVTGTQCDANGNLSTKLVANTALIPSNSQWRFTICDNTGANCFNVQLAITGTTQDITTQVQAAAVILPVTNTTLLSGNNNYTGNNTHSGTETFNGPVVTASVIKETRSPQNLVAVGDSITAGNQIPIGDEWPSQAANLPMFYQRGSVTNTAVSGYTCANMTSDYVTKVQPLRPAITGIPTLIGGSIVRNDIAGGGTAAAAESCVSAYWAQARTDGFKIIAFTVYDTSGGGSETERNAYNTWVKANGTLYNYLVDIDAAFPSFADTTLFLADGIHPTVLGANKIANLVNAAVGGVNLFPTVAKYEQQATSIVRAPVFSAEPSGTTPGAGYFYNLLPTRGSYERGVASWNTNVFEVGTEMTDANGKGMSNRSTRLKSALDIKFASGGVDYWQMRAAANNGSIYAITDGGPDIGTSGSARPNNIYTKTSLNSLSLNLHNLTSGAGFLNVYNTLDSITAPVNFERGVMKWAANTLRIGAEAAGTGTLRPVQLVGASVAIGTNGTALTAVITATATLTYTAIAAQTCQDQPITVPNASATNFGVTASPRASLGNANLSWSAWVNPSTPGAIQAHVCNPTAGSITPAAVAWGATVTQ